MGMTSQFLIKIETLFAALETNQSLPANARKPGYLPNSLTPLISTYCFDSFFSLDEKYIL